MNMMQKDMLLIQVKDGMIYMEVFQVDKFKLKNAKRQSLQFGNILIQ